MKTTQDEFHPMRGHVEDGCIIHMRNGDDVTLKNTMRGWQLFIGDRPHAAPTTSAHVIACLVEVYPSESL